MADSSLVLCIVGIAVIVVVAQNAKKLFGSGDSNDHQQHPGRRADITESMIDVVQAIVPWIPRQEIMRDLQETHSVEDTTMRFVEAARDHDLSPGAGVARAQMRTRAQLAAQQQAQVEAVANAKNNQAEASLLRRFGITSNQNTQSEESSPPAGWSKDRDSREERLNSQRRKIVLRAREKMLAKKAGMAKLD